ncbi:hypothetical protein [Litorihabitans aurantiacus]|uniref:Lipoprotein n=1 Tax=Litorihabitans aurantiacus TaxID=1930061 RepID=A0AA37XGQ3_9MICO|nr:hypothetical protein [Litorihabitans aurantiacus]GMA32497.1 hypothetical protein GCM10025875_24890 [Litorihabitans aurantiacus]
MAERRRGGDRGGRRRAATLVVAVTIAVAPVLVACTPDPAPAPPTSADVLPPALSDLPAALGDPGAAQDVIEQIADDPSGWVTRLDDEDVTAVVDVGITWAERFVAEEDGTPDLTEDARRGFVQFAAASGHETSVRFHAAVTTVLERDLVQPFADGQETPVAVAMVQAATWEGRLVGADVTHAGDFSAGWRQLAASEVALLAHARRAADGGTDALTTASGLISSDEVMTSVANYGPTTDTSDNDVQQAIATGMESVQRRSAVQAGLDAGAFPDWLLDEYGPATLERADGSRVLAPGTQAEDLAAVYFDLPIDHGTYPGTWRANLGWA